MNDMQAMQLKTGYMLTSLKLSRHGNYIC